MEPQNEDPQGWAEFIDWSHYFFLGQALCDQTLTDSKLRELHPQAELRPEPLTTPCWLCQKSLEGPALLSPAFFRKLGLVNYRAPKPHVDVPYKSWYDEGLQHSVVMKQEGLVAMQRGHRWSEVATFPYPVDEEQILGALSLEKEWSLYL
jgi:hypothetical protein